MRNRPRFEIVYAALFMVLLFGCSAPEKPQQPEPTQGVQPDPYTCPPDTFIEIPDKEEFYPRLLARFGKSSGDSITCGELQSLTTFAGMSGGTIDLRGIEYAINLEGLAFANVQPADLSPLKGLKKLKRLEISVDTVPLTQDFDCNEGGFWQLSGLDTLLTLPNLESLILQGRDIKDLSVLANLTHLKTLNLRCNLIEDVSPLARLTQLESLVLGGNRITNISPLASLTNLTELHLDRNCPKNLGALKNLTGLQILSISGDTSAGDGPTYCPLEDFQPLENLNRLEYLDIINTNFRDTSLLLRFPELKRIDLSQNMITDITPVARLIAQGLLKTDEYGRAGLNLVANNIKNADVQEFSMQLPVLESGQYGLILAYNCLDLSQTQVITDLLEKGLSLTYYEPQKPECNKRVQFRSGLEPIFY